MKKADIERCIQTRTFVRKETGYGQSYTLLPIEITTKKTNRHGSGVSAVKCEIWSVYKGEATPQIHHATGQICTEVYGLNEISGEQTAWFDSKCHGLTTENIVELVRKAHEEKEDRAIQAEIYRTRTIATGDDLMTRLQALTGITARRDVHNRRGYETDISKVSITVDELATLVELLESAGLMAGKVGA
jgi:hypothetical protein